MTVEQLCRRAAGSPDRRSTSTGDGSWPRGRPGWWSGRDGRTGSPGLIPVGGRGRDCPAPQDVAVGQGCADDRAITWRVAGWAVPSVATIHRALVRRGVGHRAAAEAAAVVVATVRVASPERRVADRRDLLGAAVGHARCGSWTSSMTIPDVVVAARVVAGPTERRRHGTAFCDGDAALRDCRRMSCRDNGTCFTARFFSGRSRSRLRTRPAHAGCPPHSVRRPDHPQTCGKIERFHQTLKRWLRTQTLARSHRQLQRPTRRFRRVLQPRPAPQRSGRRHSGRTLARSRAGHLRRPDPRSTACKLAQGREQTTSSAGASTSSALGRVMSANTCS